MTDLEAEKRKGKSGGRGGKKKPKKMSSSQRGLAKRPGAKKKGKAGSGKILQKEGDQEIV